MDALCHAIESYTCLQKNPLSDAYSISAINIIRENLILSVKNGNNKSTRLAMANASLMAGIAFSNSMVGIIHAIGHSLGSICHIPHGEAMAILMPHCMRFNKDKLEKEYSELLLYIAGPEVYSSTKKDFRADEAIKYVEMLLDELHTLSGLPRKLSEIGVNKNQFEDIAKKAINDGAIIVNPKQESIEEIIEILNNAY